MFDATLYPWTNSYKVLSKRRIQKKMNGDYCRDNCPKTKTGGLYLIL